MRCRQVGPRFEGRASRLESPHTARHGQSSQGTRIGVSKHGKNLVKAEKLRHTFRVKGVKHLLNTVSLVSLAVLESKLL